MFEKLGSQSTDDAFVEAATDADARREYIAKLSKARVQLTRLLIATSVIFLFNLAIELLAPLTTVRSSLSQTLSTLQVIWAGLLATALLIGLVSNDLAIKFLKALEAGAQQATPADNEREIKFDYSISGFNSNPSNKSMWPIFCCLVRR